MAVMPEKYAVINIGTLKTKCLLAYFDRGNLVPLYQSNNLTCFGCEMFESGNIILEKNLNCTIEELNRLKEIVAGENCNNLRVFATHALRDAVNQKQILEIIKDKTKLEVEIINSKEEADLYYQSVINDLIPNQEYIIIDSGGGSCQISIGGSGGARISKSYKTGAQQLHERFSYDPHNPKGINTPDDIKRMKEFLIKEYADLPNDIGLPLVYGSSNIIKLFEFIKIPMEPYPTKAHPYKTAFSSLSEFTDGIIKFPYEKREEKYPFQTGYMWGIDKAFTNIAVLGEKFASPYLIPSNSSIVEGFLRKMRDNN